MNVSKEIKKAEAIKRMEVLGLFKPCIRAFKSRNEIQLSEPTGGLYEFSANEELTEKVKEFEEEHDALVYHVIHTYTEFGDLYSFLYVGDNDEEWEMDNDDIKDGYVFSYVYNRDCPDFSEFGTIAVKPRFGGLVRVG